MPDEPRSSRNVITVTTVTRPKRIAFLIDPDNASAQSQVDELIQHAIGRWGGGHYPIIATDGVAVAEDGWRVMRAVDPDVVCAVTPIDDNLSTRIAEGVAPGAIERLVDRQREHLPASISGHPFSAVDVHDIPRYLLGLQPWGIPHRFLYVKETHNTNPAIRAFALRNFGTIRETISTKQAFEGLPIENLGLDEVDFGGLLETFVQFHGRLITLHDLSLSAANLPYSLQYDQFARGFHLVVGDSVRDVMYAWNRRLISEGWMGRDVLWLPTSLAQDASLLAVIGKWISRQYFNNHGPQGFVVSHSADRELLERVATEVQKTAWMHFASRILERNQFPFPETTTAGYGVLRDPPPRRTEQIPLADDTGLLSLPVPPFLASRRGAEDGWMVDLDIEYHLDPPRFSNRPDSWRLPKRAVLGHLFAESAKLARVVNSGLPSAEVKRTDQFIRLTIPSKRRILHGLLQRADAKGTPRQVRFPYFETSEQGRRLSGIIGLFGSLEYAGQTFDDGYWRSILLQLAGVAANQRKSQVTRVEKMLEQASGGDGIGISEARATLANRLVVRLEDFARQTPSIAWDELRQRFSEPKRAGSEHSSIADSESFEDLKAREVQAFLEGGILVQGVSLRCEHCGKEDWWTTSALSSEVRCDGCLRSFAFPANPTWRFRLNSLIRNGITKAGVLAVLHTLHKKAQLGHDLFVYLPCQALYEDHAGAPYTDLDLIAIRDGQIIIGEVKSSAEAFKDTDFAKLRSVAEEIRPNALVLAATGTEWPPEVTRKAEALQASLAPVGVTVEKLLLPW